MRHVMELQSFLWKWKEEEKETVKALDPCIEKLTESHKGLKNLLTGNQKNISVRKIWQNFKSFGTVGSVDCSRNLC